MFRKGAGQDYEILKNWVKWEVVQGSTEINAQVYKQIAELFWHSH